MIIKMCAKCGKLIEHPNKYCDICKVKEEKYKEERQKIYDSRYDKKRNQKYVKFRKSKEWLLLKERYLSDLQIKYNNIKYAYKCEDCIEENLKDSSYKIRLAEEVHHLIFIETPEGWVRRLDYHNLRALCHKHHDKRHNRFQSRNAKNGIENRKVR